MDHDIVAGEHVCLSQFACTCCRGGPRTSGHSPGETRTQSIVSSVGAIESWPCRLAQVHHPVPKKCPQQHRELARLFVDFWADRVGADRRVASGQGSAAGAAFMQHLQRLLKPRLLRLAAFRFLDPADELLAV
jgi:hypothetical protein